MVKQAIINYYLICKIKRDKERHIISGLSDEIINAIMTKKQIDDLLIHEDSEYSIKEYLIGGDPEES